VWNGLNQLSVENLRQDKLVFRNNKKGNQLSDDGISSTGNCEGRKWTNKSAWSSTLLVTLPSSLMRCYYRQLLHPEYPRFSCQVNLLEPEFDI
jgi:hypothetical protein